MPAIEIDKYIVTIGRGGDSPGFPRTMRLDAKNPSTAPVATVYVYFFVPGNASGEGLIGNQQTTFARAYVPIADFDAFYRVVQSERPVYFYWTLDSTSATSRTMRSYSLSTGPELPGEGPTDGT